MIDAHSDIAMLRRESHWVVELFLKGAGLTADEAVTGETIAALLDDSHFKNLEMDEKSVLSLLRADGSMSYSEFVSAIFDLYGRSVQKRLVGDKCPGYVRRLRILHDLWPQAKIVHLIRDGRDVALSFLSWTQAERRVGRLDSWSKDPLSTAALWWEWNVRLGIETGRSFGAHIYREQRYERLLGDPEVECKELCSFLEVPYDATMLTFHQGRTKPGRSAKKRWLPLTPGLRDWRTQMVSGDVERFEAVAGALLEELGYERGARPRLDHPFQEVLGYRQEFLRHQLSRRQPVPASWM